jgi:ABC-type lipoprotein release transport system permease subunit
VKALEARIAAVPGVTAVAARGEAYALVSSDTRTRGAAIIGVQPEREPALSTIPASLRTGRFLAANDAVEAIVGRKLARTLALSPGDTLTVLGQGSEGSLAAATLTVVGIFESGEPDLDRSTVEIPLGTFQETFSLPDAAHAIAVRTEGLDHVERVSRAVSAELSDRSGIVVLTWQDLLEGLEQGIKLDEAIGWFLYAVLVFVVTFSILNTFLMAVLERTREFGVLIALGTRPDYLGLVVMTESVLLLLLGLLVGLALGIGVTAFVGHHGLAFSGSDALLARWNLPARIYPRLDPYSLTLGPAIILVVTSIAALFPLVRIRRLRPTDAMKAV